MNKRNNLYINEYQINYMYIIPFKSRPCFKIGKGVTKRYYSRLDVLIQEPDFDIKNSIIVKGKNDDIRRLEILLLSVTAAHVYQINDLRYGGFSEIRCNSIWEHTINLISAIISTERQNIYTKIDFKECVYNLDLLDEMIFKN